MDQATATLITAFAALVVGLAATTASIITSVQARRGALDLQLAGERSRSLLSFLEIAQVRSIYAHDSIFNMTEAVSKENPMLGDPGRPYGPDVRALVKLPPSDAAKAAALLAVYGSWDIRVSYVKWLQELEDLERSIDAVSYNAYEQLTLPRAEDFAIGRLKETAALSGLGQAITTELSKPPRLGQKPAKVQNTSKKP